MFFKKKVHTWNDLADNSNRFLPRDNKDIAIYINANEWIDLIWPKEGKKLLPAGIVWPWILSLHPINIYKYEIKIYKYEIKIYKYETTFGMSFVFINDDY
jgi:hypothetical protein